MSGSILLYDGTDRITRYTNGENTDGGKITQFYIASHTTLLDQALTET